MRSLLRILKARTGKRPKTASSPLRAVVGLRNPGSDYEGTRHNVGYEVVDEYLRRQGEKLGKGPGRVRAQLARLGPIGDATVVIVPATFMNESGQGVRSALDYYKIPVEEMLVVHDDIDLPFGRLRLQVGGGSGGHNGIRSMERALGSNDFSRLKVGVGRPPGSQDPADFVLRPFTRQERPEVDFMVQDAADVVETWTEDVAKAQEQAALRGRDA